MQNPIYLHLPGHMAALPCHFGSPDTTIILGEVPVAWNVSRRQGLRALVGVAEYLTALVGGEPGTPWSGRRCPPSVPPTESELVRLTMAGLSRRDRGPTVQAPSAAR